MFEYIQKYKFHYALAFQCFDQTRRKYNKTRLFIYLYMAYIIKSGF